MFKFRQIIPFLTMIWVKLMIVDEAFSCSTLFNRGNYQMENLE